MLLQLSGSCARHRSRHEKGRISAHPNDVEGEVPKFCQDVINTLRKVMPKVEQAYRASTNPRVEDIGHICDFFEQVIEGGFCPHAPHLLRLGKRVNDGKRLYFFISRDCMAFLISVILQFCPASIFYSRIFFLRLSWKIQGPSVGPHHLARLACLKRFVRRLPNW